MLTWRVFRLTGRTPSRSSIACTCKVTALGARLRPRDRCDARAFELLCEGRPAEETVLIVSPMVRKCKTLWPAALVVHDWCAGVRRMSPRHGAVADSARPSQQFSKPRLRAIS